MTIRRMVGEVLLLCRTNAYLPPDCSEEGTIFILKLQPFSLLPHIIYYMRFNLWEFAEVVLLCFVILNYIQIKSNYATKIISLRTGEHDGLL